MSALILWVGAWAVLGVALAVTTHLEENSRKVGGITFVRFGRIQFSYCVVRRKRLDK